MKKILFILPYYKIGGTLTSFSNLIPLIDKNEYEVSAFALTNDVDDVAILPKGVNYIGLNTGTASENTARKGLKSKIISFLKLGKRLLTKLGYDPSDIVFKKMAKALSGKYDVVIAFQEGQATRMAQYVSESEKIAWIHSIYSRFKSFENAYTDVYCSFDKIVCVSHTAAKDMLDCEPQWKKKIYVVYNSIDKNIVNEKAAVGKSFNKAVNLVSVGRIDPVKRFSCIPEIANKLLASGFDFDWWIIGGVVVREEYDNLIANIKKYHVEEYVHPLGALSNPYPYIKSANMLVCLSSSETFNYTIAEAKAIGIPVVSTDFPCAFEFIEHEKTGLILPIEKVAEGIKRMLEDNTLYLDIQKCLLSSKEETTITKEQFQSLLKNE